MSNEQYFSPEQPGLNDNKGDKSWMTTILLALFLGPLGIHRFYTGYVWIGVVQLVLTLTGIGSLISVIWALIDLISIAINKFQDAKGNALVGENPGCGMIVLIVLGVSALLAVVGTISSLWSVFLPH